MWKARQKEKEMDDRVRKYEQKRANNVIHESQKNANVRFDDYGRKHSSLCSSSKSPSEDELKDKEIEEFLLSRYSLFLLFRLFGYIFCPIDISQSRTVEHRTTCFVMY